LGLALSALGVACEDVEDQCCSVDDFHADPVLEIAQLGGRQLSVADHRICACGNHNVAQLGHLAASNVGRRVWSIATLDKTFQDLRSSRLGERLELCY
jgi:hypothetical protein